MPSLLEQIAPDLQAQIDRLTLALEQSRDTRDQLQPMAQGLAQLTERYTELLDRLTVADDRHAQVLDQAEARLGEWSAIENRLQRDTADRLRELEQSIEHEWQALRQVHEEPVRQLREQAAALGETCAAAASLALQSFQRTEARLSAIETDLHGRLNQLSREVQAALAEARSGAARPALPPAQPFPLDGVLRIHDELRRDAQPADPAASASEALVPADAPASRQAAVPAVEQTALSTRVASLEAEVTHGKDEVRETASRADRLRRDWRRSVGLLAAAVIAVGAAGLWWQMRVDARLDAAAARVADAERHAATVSEAANRQMASARADAQREIAEARQAAHKAEIVSDVLAAPDLVRLNLAGLDAAAGASAQVLWSRSRGVVLSASRLPVAPSGSVYQVWLLSNTAPLGVGTFQADDSGRATLAVDVPPDTPRPITGVEVTLEPAGSGGSGSTAPSGPTVLARAAQ